MEKKVKFKGFFFCVVLTLFVGILIGCSDDDFDYQESYNVLTKDYISGKATDGDPVMGTVYLKNSTQTKSVGTNVDGSFSIDITGMSPPFLLWVNGVVHNTAITYYGYMSADEMGKMIHLNELSHAAVQRALNGVDPTTYYSSNSDLPSEAAIEDAKDEICKAASSIIKAMKNVATYNADPLFIHSATFEDEQRLLKSTSISYDTINSIFKIKDIIDKTKVLYSIGVVSSGYLVQSENDTRETLNNSQFLMTKEIVRLKIIQTSDLHNHASGYGPFNDYTPLDQSDHDMVTGGYSRIASMIAKYKLESVKNDYPLLIVDSGDFLMGTIYDLTSMKSPITFQIFQGLGYDAITLGNHEYDWTVPGLADTLTKAYQSGFRIPIIATNLTTSDESPVDDDIEKMIAKKIIVGKSIKTYSNGLKVGILGLLGKNAALYAPSASPLTFKHDGLNPNVYYDFVQEKVDDLRENDKCHLVVILSHSGIKPYSGTYIGDDIDLANNVTGIDVIASGHAHTATPSPVKINNTYIFSPGQYGEYLNIFDLEIAIDLYDTNPSTSYTVISPYLLMLPINDSIPGYAAIESAIQGGNEQLSAEIQKMGLPAIDAHIAKTSFALTINELDPKETGLGNLTADANRAVANGIVMNDPNDNTPFFLGITSNGCIRDGLYPGKEGIITFSDIYNVVPLGISPTMVPGYPLLSVFYNANDIRNFCQIAAFVASKQNPDFPGEFYFNLSGVKYKYDPTTFIVNDVALYSPADTSCTSPVALSLTSTMMDKESKVVYRAAINLYLVNMIYSLLNQEAYSDYHDYLPLPKDKDGNLLAYDSINSHIIYSNGIDLKEYIALWQYLNNMPLEGDLHVIPDQSPYNQSFIPYIKRVLTD